jgi:hypothetical protein
LLTLAVIGPLDSCGSGPFTTRFKTTVVVQTPHGLDTFSNVIEEVVIFNDGIMKGLSSAALNVGLKGEALAVNENGRYVFFLLEGEGKNRNSVEFPAEFYNLHKELWDPGGVSADTTRRIQQTKGQVHAPLAHMPLCVTFRDINDPTSIEIVNPIHIDQVLGDGYAIKDVAIEVTDEPVTANIQKILSWWGGPFPWMKQIKSGNAEFYVDMRTDWPRMMPEDFRQGFFK